MGGRQQFQGLFEHLPGVCFFVKDADGRFMAANALCLKRMGFNSEVEVIGKTDADVHPERVAREIREDDLRVMRSREPLVDRVEALSIRSQAKDWCVTTKLPIFDRAGTVLGVMGFVRPFRSGEMKQASLARLEPVVAFIQKHHGAKIEIPRLAKLAHVSSRQLHRLFQAAFGIPPLEPLTEPPTQSAIAQHRLQLTFRRIRADLTHLVEASSTLAPDAWQPIATNPGAVGELVTVSDTLEIQAAMPSRRFLRVRVVLP